ncbi:MAG TPA: hypothetical protein VIV11_03135 [Kofleriaceae bacterium]
MPDSDDLAARVELLERENAALREKLEALDPDRTKAERPHDRAESRPQLELITRDDTRRSRLAKLMFAGGALALLGGIFGSSWFAVLCGLGWLFGGAAVASTVPRSGGES